MTGICFFFSPFPVPQEQRPGEDGGSCRLDHSRWVGDGGVESEGGPRRCSLLTSDGAGSSLLYPLTFSFPWEIPKTQPKIYLWIPTGDTGFLIQSIFPSASAVPAKGWRGQETGLSPRNPHFLLAKVCFWESTFCPFLLVPTAGKPLGRVSGPHRGICGYALSPESWGVWPGCPRYHGLHWTVWEYSDQCKTFWN